MTTPREPLGEVDITHIESWAVAITPPPGETWPVIVGGEGRNDLQPDLILANVIPGQPLSITGSGRRMKRDQTLGQLRVSAPWFSLEDLPDWARKLLTDALRQHSLNQLTEHKPAPLPGSVRNSAGRPVRRLLYETDSYPLTALCHECHAPIGSVSFEAGWTHAGGS